MSNRKDAGSGSRRGCDPGPKINRFLQRLLGHVLGEEDARVFLSELRERYELKREKEGAGPALEAFRRESRGALILAFLARLRGESPAPPQTDRGLGKPNPRGTFMDSFRHDTRFGFRSLRRRPLFSFIAILTLGLGIGSATSIFSVVEGVVLRPLPFHEPRELVTVTQTIPERQSHESLSRTWDRIAGSLSSRSTPGSDPGQSSVG